MIVKLGTGYLFHLFSSCLKSHFTFSFSSSKNVWTNLSLHNQLKKLEISIYVSIRLVSEGNQHFKSLYGNKKKYCEYFFGIKYIKILRNNNNNDKKNIYNSKTKKFFVSVCSIYTYILVYQSSYFFSQWKVKRLLHNNVCHIPVSILMVSEEY